MGLEQFQAEGTIINVSSACCIVILQKGAITEVILTYDLNARDFFHGDTKFSRNFARGCQILLGILHGDAKFSREFCMGMPNSLGNSAWDAEFPWGTKNIEGVPKSLGDLTRGCQILEGARSPMTPEVPYSYAISACKI